MIVLPFGRAPLPWWRVSVRWFWWTSCVWMVPIYAMLCSGLTRCVLLTFEPLPSFFCSPNAMISQGNGGVSFPFPQEALRNRRPKPGVVAYGGMSPPHCAFNLGEPRALSMCT